MLQLNMPKKSRAFRFAGLLLCLFAFALSAVAGPVAESNAPFIVDSWGTENGLPDSEVISVIQTHDGYLWLGTLHGLVRFDGIHFTIFNENNTPGLNSDRIVYLLEDSQTNLWVGTESSGLSVIKNGNVKSFGNESGTGGGKVVYAYQDAATNVWFYTADRRLFRYHDGQMDFHPAVLSAQLLFRAARMVVPSKSGGFWRIQNGTVQKWENNRLGKDYGPCPWDNTIVTSACEDNDGNLIVGTLGAGIFWYDANGNYQNISTNQGLSSVYVLSLCLDREGNLWAGTDGDGLNRIKRKYFTTPAGLSPWDAQSLAADDRRRIMGGFWRAWRVGLDHQFRAKFLSRTTSGCLGNAGGSSTTDLGRNAG